MKATLQATSTTRRLVLFVLALGIVLGLTSSPAAAQQRFESWHGAPAVDMPVKTVDFGAKNARWRANFERQVARLLEDENPEMQVAALQYVILVSSHHPGRYNFSGAVPKILDLYEDGSDEALRMMALSALHATGSAYAMERLGERVRQERSERIRKLTLAALKDYQERRRH